ncbi:uridine kinase [Parapedobacter sp. 2B3]|uniref:uridine kinase family protein n=1 Tax=Parapedobacter sp. 2B3 TaxID=3342381 RepID=UPI0035B67ACE
MSQTSTPFVVGIAGSSGSGKTFFLNGFVNHFAPDEVALISQDDYYIPANTKTKEENKLYNFDLPTAIDRSAFYHDIRLLFEGQPVYRKEYTFNNPTLEPKMIETKPAPILIVEGLFIFYYEEINALLNHRIFLHAEEEVALRRRLKRDLIERGYDDDDVRYKWMHHVMPAYREYLLPFRKQCDRVIINNADDPGPIIAITHEISADLRQRAGCATRSL